VPINSNSGSSSDGGTSNGGSSNSCAAAEAAARCSKAVIAVSKMRIVVVEQRESFGCAAGCASFVSQASLSCPFCWINCCSFAESFNLLCYAARSSAARVSEVKLGGCSLHASKSAAGYTLGGQRLAVWRVVWLCGSSAELHGMAGVGMVFSCKLCTGSASSKLRPGCMAAMLSCKGWRVGASCSAAGYTPMVRAQSAHLAVWQQC
jgi:hypothetical protein